MLKLSNLLVVPLALTFVACESMPRSSDTKASATSEEGADEAEDSKDEVAKSERKLEDARIELRIANADAESAAQKSTDEVEGAGNALRIATEALDQFMKAERELELSQVTLGLDQASWRVEAEKQELAELEAMYKRDDVATLTKELVLQRGKKGVEFAERSLAHEQREASAKRDFELPRKQRELEFEKKEKDNALRDARAEAAKGKDQVELALRKAKAEVDDAEKALAKARTKAAKP